MPDHLPRHYVRHYLGGARASLDFTSAAPRYAACRPRCCAFRQKFERAQVSMQTGTPAPTGVVPLTDSPVCRSKAEERVFSAEAEVAACPIETNGTPGRGLANGGSRQNSIGASEFFRVQDTVIASMRIGARGGACGVTDAKQA